MVNNADDMDKTMTMGNKNSKKFFRQLIFTSFAFFPTTRYLYPGSVGATNMNATSSRSHAIFTITIERSEKGLDGQQHLRMGKLHMVDLAVSNN